jgi:hypothetical protein
MTHAKQDRAKLDRPSSAPTINLEKVCYIIVKAREFDAKEASGEPDPGSNPSDDGGAAILLDQGDDPTLEELVDGIDGLNEDEQVELVALTWLGRGDFDRREWRDAVALARERHNEQTARYLAGMPMLGDLLEEGLAAFGKSIGDFEIGRL